MSAEQENNQSVIRLPMRPGSLADIEPKLTGTKRSISGKPKSHFDAQPHCDTAQAPNKMTLLASAEPSHGCPPARGSSKDSESDSSDECNAIESYDLPENHPFQQQRSELLRFSYIKFKEWSKDAQYDEPPRKGSRTSNWRQPQPFIEQHEDHCDTDMVVISRQKDPFHLACPFYTLDTEKYRHCLLLYDQPSIEELIGHIERHHMKPPYCPRCFGIFDTAIDRDDHILNNTCDLRSPVPIDGIDQYQREEIKTRDKVSSSEAKRWRRIWAIAFPLAEEPNSAYLDQAPGLTVSMARDFWAFHGWQCVTGLLRNKCILSETERDHSAAALCKLVLYDLLNYIIENTEGV